MKEWECEDLFASCMHGLTAVHLHTTYHHGHTHTHTHTHTHASMRARMLTPNVLTCVNTPLDTGIYSMYPHTCACAYLYTHSRILTHSCVCVRDSAQTHARNDDHTHTHARARAHTPRQARRQRQAQVLALEGTLPCSVFGVCGLVWVCSVGFRDDRV